MTNLALKAYTLFEKEDKEKARVFSEIFETIANDFESKEHYAKKEDLWHSTSQINLEIEKLRTEAKETELKLSKEIEQVRVEGKETELKLSKEIEKVRTEIEKVRTEIKNTENNILKHLNRQIVWTIGSVSFMLATLKALDYLLKY